MSLLLSLALLLHPALGADTGPFGPRKSDARVEEPCASPLLSQAAHDKDGKRTRAKPTPPCPQSSPPSTAEKEPREQSGPQKAKAEGLSLGSLESALSPQEAALREERLERLFHGSAWSGEEPSAPVHAASSADGTAPEEAQVRSVPAFRKTGSDAPPPAPESSKRLISARGPLFRLSRTFDGLEDRCIRGVIGAPPLKAFFLWLLGTEKAVLYRGVSRGEVRNLAANHWRYDTSDRRNLYKFTTPDKGIALAYARKHRGCVVEIQAEDAVPYYKLTRFWNRLRYSKAAQEHLVLVDGKEATRLVGGSGCESVP